MHILHIDIMSMLKICINVIQLNTVVKNNTEYYKIHNTEKWRHIFGKQYFNSLI